MTTIQLKKFGKILNSRPAAKEAVLRVKQIINGSEGNIILDFSDVDILTPSFADEFVKDLREIYKDKKIEFKGIEENKLIKDTLEAVKAL